MANQYTGNIIYSEDLIIYKYPDKDIYIFKDKLIDYYITQNHSKKDTCLYYGISDAQLSNCIKRFDCKKSGHLASEINKQTKLERYGNSNYNNKEKQQRTCLEKYGIDNIFKNVNYMKQCRKEKIGVEYPAQDIQILSKILVKRKEKYGEKLELLVEKQKQTNKQRYGVEFSMQREEVKDKFRNNKESRIKAWKTKKLNGTTNISNEEETFYSWLISIFTVDDIERNYICDRYPYHVDFYIKSLDCFIELNIFWTHGPHPFDNQDMQDLRLLEEFRNKSVEHPQYVSAINVWTIRDPEKQKCALENDLFYLSAYNKEDIDNIKEVIINAKECYEKR